MLFGGSVPHLFYTALERLISDEVGHSITKKLLVERLVFAPIYQAFVIYMLARFEGKSHNATIKQVERTYWPIIQANWKWLTIIQFINLSFVPPMVSEIYFIVRNTEICHLH